ncbi:MAG: SIS domain-containing protein [bacterium]
MVNRIEVLIRDIIQENIRINKLILDEKLEFIIRVTDIILGALKNKKKVLFFGNGGSAADAQHLAAEFVNRFLFDRPSLPAIALTTDTSVLTSIANDSDYRFIFSRQIEALGDEGDVAIGISTSGTSPNVLEALEKARTKGMKTIAFIGGRKGDLLDRVDVIISVPSTDIPRIQEAHIMLGHIICHLVEEGMFPKP